MLLDVRHVDGPAVQLQPALGQLSIDEVLTGMFLAAWRRIADQVAGEGSLRIETRVHRAEELGGEPLVDGRALRLSHCGPRRGALMPRPAGLAA